MVAVFADGTESRSGEFAFSTAVPDNSLGVGEIVGIVIGKCCSSHVMFIMLLKCLKSNFCSAGIVFLLLVTALIVVVIRLRRHQNAIPDGIRRGAHSLYGRVVRPKSTHSSATGNNYHDPDEIGAGGGREMYANPAYHADTKDPKV